MRRRTFLQALAGAAVWPVHSDAQSSKVHTILWVSTEGTPDPFLAGFREGLREHGLLEGHNVRLILRYAPGNPGALHESLPEILGAPVDLIASSGPAILVTRAVTHKPVLFAISSDPVALGIADSLARPGRNFTGITFLSLDVAQKRVELMKELMPQVATLAVLSNTTHPGEQQEYEATQKAAEAFSIRLIYAPFTSGTDIDAALMRIRAAQPDALIAFPGGATRVHKAKIAEFSNANGLPSLYGSREHCEVGGLASYGASQRAAYVRLASFASRLLRGETADALPIEQPTAFELVLNLKTARALQFEIPPGLLARADEVIE